jgi:hypothetical protein
MSPSSQLGPPPRNCVWLPPPPPPPEPKGAHTPAMRRVRGGGGLNSDDGRESLVLCLHCALGILFLGMLSIRNFVIGNFVIWNFVIWNFVIWNFVIWNFVIWNSVIRNIGIRNSIPAPSVPTVQLKRFSKAFHTRSKPVLSVFFLQQSGIKQERQFVSPFTLYSTPFIKSIVKKTAIKTLRLASAS